MNVTVRLSDEKRSHEEGIRAIRRREEAYNYDRDDTATKTNGERNVHVTLSPVCLPTRKSSLTDSNARPSLRFFIFDDFLAPLVRDRSILDSVSERH